MACYLEGTSGACGEGGGEKKNPMILLFKWI